MKKLFLLTGFILFTGLAATLILSQSKASESYRTTGTEIPADVKAVFENSCTPCHFEGGSGLALSKINFSAWDTYTPQKAAKKSGAICTEILNHGMPPANFAKSNPGKVPTKEQAEIVCKWAESLVYKK